MHSLLKILTLITVTSLVGISLNAQTEYSRSGSTIISSEDVDAGVIQGLANLEDGRSVSDIVLRHINVGEENMGVSLVQRGAVAPTEVETGIAHVNLDEIYYVLSGEGTMVTGGEFVNKQVSNSNLLGPMERGEIKGGVLQRVKPGDIAIISKGMPHGWHEISTDTISYLVFRGDPDKVMAEK